QFIVENHLSNQIIDPLLDLIKDITKTYPKEIIQRAHNSPPTMSRIITHCIGKPLKEELFKELKDSPFSILLDETSDLYGSKYVGLLVRYLKPEEDLPTPKLLSFIEIEQASTGEVLFNKIIEELFDNDYELENNLISVCTDNAQNLI